MYSYVRTVHSSILHSRIYIIWNKYSVWILSKLYKRYTKAIRTDWSYFYDIRVWRYVTREVGVGLGGGREGEENHVGHLKSISFRILSEYWKRRRTDVNRNRPDTQRNVCRNVHILDATCIYVYFYNPAYRLAKYSLISSI